MNSFRTKNITVTRKYPGTYSDGVWSEGSDYTFTISASVQPLSPREMEMLPEARRTKEAYKVFSSIKLIPAEETSQTNADLLSIGGETFEVVSCGSYQSNVLSHYKAMVVKV